MVAAVSQHFHARYGSSRDVAGDGDSRHSLASVLPNLAEEVGLSDGQWPCLLRLLEKGTSRLWQRGARC